MNYKLGKELKDAGFPMEEWKYHSDGSREPYIPTLEELIEACGEIEFRIHCYPKSFGTDVTKEPWFVIERPNWSDMPRCSTPLEAVARLWLTLNKK